MPPTMVKSKLMLKSFKSQYQHEPSSAAIRICELVGDRDRRRQSPSVLERKVLKAAVISTASFAEATDRSANSQSELDD